MKAYEFILKRMQSSGLVNDIPWTQVELCRTLTPDEHKNGFAHEERRVSIRFDGDGSISQALEYLITQLEMDTFWHWRVSWENAGVFYSVTHTEWYRFKMLAAIQAEANKYV